jgi:hypothetical protein
MKHIGFTGTRSGMSAVQKTAFAELLESLVPCVFHHGDCVGADSEAHLMARTLGISVVIHPPVKEDLRAFCEGASEERTPKSYFARNRDIVNECSLLIATPYTNEETSGGTWYTINYAKRVKKTVAILQRQLEVK